MASLETIIDDSWYITSEIAADISKNIAYLARIYVDRFVVPDSQLQSVMPKKQSIRWNIQRH